MSIFAVTHAATNVGAGSAFDGQKTKLHVHTLEFSCASGTGDITVIHYGRSGGGGQWYPIVTLTLTGASSGDKTVPQTLEHSWDEYKSECTALSGTGTGKVGLSTMSGA